MSHQFSSGVILHSQPAWHRLGLVLDGTLPAREAFRLGGADFQLASRPIYDADMRPTNGSQSITRTETGAVLSVMNSPYELVQNEQLIRVAEALHSDAVMDAVCVLSGGKKVTFTARVLQSEGEVFPGDPVNQCLVGCTAPAMTARSPSRSSSRRSGWCVRTPSPPPSGWPPPGAAASRAAASATPASPTP